MIFSSACLEKEGELISSLALFILFPLTFECTDFIHLLFLLHPHPHHTHFWYSTWHTSPPGECQNLVASISSSCAAELFKKCFKILFRKKLCAWHFH